VRYYELTDVTRPTGAFAFVLLLFFLKLNKRPSKTLREHISRFDFLGLFLIVAAVVLLLVGFSEGENDCMVFDRPGAPIRALTILTGSAPKTIACIAIGGALFLVAALNESLTKRDPIIPPRLFKTRTTGLILVCTFLHAVTFFNGAYYLPLAVRRMDPMLWDAC
jgi:hypothetical protein